MPRPRKPPRLWLAPARRDAAGRVLEPAHWCIRDGPRKIRTGAGADDLRSARAALAAYLSSQAAPREDTGDPFIADIVADWLAEVAARRARPGEAAGRARNVLEAFGALRASALTTAACRAYAERRGPVARRELEDLRAAVNHARQEGRLAVPVALALPERRETRQRWLTRGEAARLLLAAWRLRQSWKGQGTGRATARHLARFILVALYTGSRAGVICGASWQPAPGRGHVDLAAGVFLRAADGARRTKKRAPPIPLPERLLAHLRRWHDRGISRVAVVEWNGRPVTRVDKAFRSARRAAGLGDDVVAHTLRHTAATWGMQTGEDLWRLARYLGMTVETLERVYGHHHPQHLRRAAESIARRPGQKPD